MDGVGDIISKRSRQAKPNKYLHSPAHLLADEISTVFGEKKRFAMYLGVIKRVGVEEARRIYRTLQQEGTGSGKLFMYLCRKAPPAKPGEAGSGLPAGRQGPAGDGPAENEPPKA